jgi:hypothetical protein
VRAGDSCNCRSQIKRVSAWVLSLSVDFLGAVSPDTVNRQLSGWALSLRCPNLVITRKNQSFEGLLQVQLRKAL